MALSFYPDARPMGLIKDLFPAICRNKKSQALDKNHPIYNPGGRDTPLRKTNINKKIKNMNTSTEKIGVVSAVIGYMQDVDNQAALKLKNFDVAPHILRLTAGLGAVNTLKPIQLKMEVAHMKATADLNNASYGAYNDASGVIDAMMGMLGKGTTAAKKLQNIRSKVRKHSSTPPPTPTPPLTVAAAAAK